LVGGGIGDGLPTLADLAILADIGYQVPAIQSSTIPYSLAYVLDGTFEDDYLFGLDNDDRLDGKEGNDTLTGRNGNDIIYGGIGNDTLQGDAGNDQLFGDTGDDYILGGDGNDTINGGAGTDVIYGNAGRDVFEISLNSGSDIIYDFSISDDVIRLSKDLGFTSPNTILQSIPSAQQAVADLGNGSVPILISSLPTGNGSTVTIWHSSPLQASNFVVQDQANTTLPPTSQPTPTSNVDTSNLPSPSAGTGIQLRGNAKPNQLTGSSRDDLILGNGGNDQLLGRSGNDRLKGGRGDDLLIGDLGDDVLRGGGGSDRLMGSLGNDALIGGAGNDVFILELGAGVDVIRGFRINEDSFGVLQGIQITQLTLTQQGLDTLISFNQDSLAIVMGVESTLLARATFSVA
jgi:Ca2+-binding RTX toxin-like protein